MTSLDLTSGESMSAKVISMNEYRIRKATEEALVRQNRKTYLPNQIIVTSGSIDFINKIIKLGYKAEYRNSYCILTRSEGPEAS